MNPFEVLLDVLLTVADVLVCRKPPDVVVLRVFPVEAREAEGNRSVVFDVQNIADAPLPIAPVVTAVFRDGSDYEVPCDICDPDRVIPMGMTKRFTATVRDGRETKQRGGVLHQVHVSLVE